MFSIPRSKLVRRYGTAASLLLVLIGGALIFKSMAAQSQLQGPVLPEGQLEPAVTGQVLAESAPVRLRIPKIDVDTSFVELGLAPDDQIEVPTGYEEVGWYRHGPTPGQLGPAVVLGHVDSHRGPAVFFYLGQLEPGDEVEIERADGTTAVFRVDKLERYPQNDFPTSLVYGDIDHAGLRLITCSGSYDRQAQRYDSNLVVYGSLIDSRPANGGEARTEAR